MRKSQLVVAISAAAALAAAPLMTATAASAAGSNTGTATYNKSYTAPTGDSQACTQLAQPGDYPSNMKLADISGLADFTPVSTAGGVKFTPTLEKRSVPGSWATWGSPPFTESATPHILYTVGATSIDVVFKKKGFKTVGFEVEPNPFAIHTFTAVLKAKSGATRCTISVDADGSAGARLLAATADGKVKTMTVSSDVDFSIAQVRWHK